MWDWESPSVNSYEKYRESDREYAVFFSKKND